MSKCHVETVTIKTNLKNDSLDEPVFEEILNRA